MQERSEARVKEAAGARCGRRAPAAVGSGAALRPPHRAHCLSRDPWGPPRGVLAPPNGPPVGEDMPGLQCHHCRDARTLRRDKISERKGSTGPSRPVPPHGKTDQCTSHTWAIITQYTCSHMPPMYVVSCRWCHGYCM